MKIAIVIMLLLSGCAATSSVMESEGGIYLISARAAPARGGTAGANSLAYEEAQKYCATKSSHAIVVDSTERDTYQGTLVANRQGGFGGFSASGNANIRFRCAKNT